MGFRIENNCVDCPQGCINCGRREQEAYFCDKCGDYADLWTPLYRFEDKELCWECYKEQFNEKMCDDMDDETCVKCHKEADFLYNKDGEWLCSECLEAEAERVEID